MNTLSFFSSALREQERKQRELEVASAAASRKDLQDLLDSPGWKRLTTSLTAALVVVYRKIGREDLTADDKAFVRVAQDLLDSPERLMEDALAIIAGQDGR